MRQIFHAPSLQEKFVKQGYVKVPALSQGEIDYLLSEIEKMRPADAFDPDGKTTTNQATYHCTFLDVDVAYKRKANELMAQFVKPYIDKYVKEYEILVSNFYVKPPGKGRFQIHQNWPTTQDFSETTLTFWIPLVDTYRENGALQVVPGSHKIVPDIAAPTIPAFFTPFKDALVEKYLQPIDMKAGECIIFCDSLIHWSANNTSDEARIAMQIETIPKECTPVYHYYDKTTAEERFEVFEVDTNFFIENSAEQVVQRPTKLKNLGFAPNYNKVLTEAEFVEKLKKGDATRSAVYSRTFDPVAFLAEEEVASKDTSWFSKLKSYFLG